MGVQAEKAVLWFYVWVMAGLKCHATRQVKFSMQEVRGDQQDVPVVSTITRSDLKISRDDKPDR